MTRNDEVFDTVAVAVYHRPEQLLQRHIFVCPHFCSTSTAKKKVVCMVYAVSALWHCSVVSHLFFIRDAGSAVDSARSVGHFLVQQLFEHFSCGLRPKSGVKKIDTCTGSTVPCGEPFCLSFVAVVRCCAGEEFLAPVH